MLSDRPSSRPALPAAVSTLSAPMLRSAPVDATVVAAHRFALYLRVGGSVLPVVTSDAVPLPTAVRLAEPSGVVSWGVGSGDVVTVGGGRVTLPGTDVVAVRTWRPARVRRQVRARAGCSGGRRGSHLRARLELERATRGGAGRDELSGSGHESAWLADGIRQVLSAAGCPGGCRGSHPGTQLEEMAAGVGALVGRGAGLTPSGDDALAGALLVTHALGTGHDLADAVRARLGATTAVSAALLDAAADGYAAHQVVALVDAAVAGHPDAVRRALPEVLAIGHTSGADTVTGIRAALEPGPACSAGRRGGHLSTRLETPNGRSAA